MAFAAVNTQRQLSRRVENLMARQGATLAAAPVKPQPVIAPPLRFYGEDERAAATVGVSVEPLLVEMPDESFETHERLAYYSEHGNRGNDLAALRAQIQGTEYGDGPSDFGPETRLAVLISMDGGLTIKKLIVAGSWAAVLRSLPDATTVAAWREAGATDFPVMLEPGRTTWVPIDEVPVVLQMEHETRGMVSNGSGN